MRFSSTLILLISLPAFSAFGTDTLVTEEWSQFRGPNGSGVSVDGRPLSRITPDMATWQVRVPESHSSPVLANALVVLTGVEDERLVTFAFYRDTGQLAWQRLAPEVPLQKLHTSNSLAASSPCVDDKHVYVYFGSYGLICYRHDGQQRWKLPIATPKSLYGASTSPILHGNLLILVLDSDETLPDSNLSQSRILALDKRTGKVVWESPRPWNRSGWSTPTVWQHRQSTELVVLGSGRLCGYDLETGGEKWFVNGFSRETISRPITNGQLIFASASMLGGVADEHPDPEPFWDAVMHFDANGDGKLERGEMTENFTFPFRPELKPENPGFGMPLPKNPEIRARVLAGMFARIDSDGDGFWDRNEFLASLSFNRAKPNLVAVRPGGTGDVTTSHVVWQLHREIPEIPTPVLYEDHIFMVRDGGILTCVRATSGDVVHRKRLGAPGHYAASPVVANDLLYVISHAGVLSVVQTGDPFHMVHQHDLGERVSATPAIDGDTFYIRTDRHLYAFRQK